MKVGLPSIPHEAKFTVAAKGEFRLSPLPKILIVCGLSFAGKSTLGKAIADRLRYAMVDVDETKQRPYGADI